MRRSPAAATPAPATATASGGGSGPERTPRVPSRRGPAGKVLLELPGGDADGDEPVEVAAARELLGETGHEAERTARLPGWPAWFRPGGWRASRSAGG
ncbi:NUDIX domain-containing protein [Streptosporangium sandarakinum]